MFALGLVTAVACLVVVLLIRRAYAASIVATLRSGLAEQVLEGDAGSPRSPVSRGVQPALRQRPTPSRLRAAPRDRVAAWFGDAEALEALVELTDDVDPTVRAAAVDGLARSTTETATAALRRSS